MGKAGKNEQDTAEFEKALEEAKVRFFGSASVLKLAEQGPGGAGHGEARGEDQAPCRDTQAGDARCVERARIDANRTGPAKKRARRVVEESEESEESE